MTNPIPLPKPYLDNRGTIQNLLELDSGAVPIRGASIITSRARTTRSEHYHQKDGHYLYVLSGEMHYWECDAEEFPSVPKYPQHPVVYKRGSLVWTGPYVWHRTYFPVETTLLSLSILPRDHESHESDVVREQR